MKPPTILVADDCPFSRRIAKTHLERRGYNVTCCADGSEALALCIDQGHKYDLIMMNCLMPMMNGYEATLRLRRAEATKHILIISVSASGRIAEADGHLSKPYRGEELFTVVNEVLKIES